MSGPCGPARRQEQGSWRRAEPAAAVGLARELYLVWTMAEGPAEPESIIYSGGALPGAVSVRRRVVNDGGAGVPSKAETDTVEPVVGARSGFSIERLDREDGWAMGVAAARASAEPEPHSMDMAKPEAKTVSGACDIHPRPAQPSVAANEAETRATNIPGGTERPSIHISGSCVRNRETWKR